MLKSQKEVIKELAKAVFDKETLTGNEFKEAYKNIVKWKWESVEKFCEYRIFMIKVYTIYFIRRNYSILGIKTTDSPFVGAN